MDRIPEKRYPLWVKMSLWGVPGRNGLWAFFALSMALALGCIVYGFWDWRFFAGSAFVFSALMYWLTIRWIDRYGSWSGDPHESTEDW